MNSPPDPNLELVTVMETTDRLTIAMAKGILEAASIPYYVAGEEISTRPGMVDPFIHRLCRVLVPRDCSAEALELLRTPEESDSVGDTPDAPDGGSEL